jgi:hypothetical protein
MSKVSELTKRTIAIVAGALFMACAANYFADLGWFVKYDKVVLGVGIALGAFLLFRLGPPKQLGRESEDREPRGSESLSQDGRRCPLDNG